jgi:hypothetical protein
VTGVVIAANSIATTQRPSTDNPTPVNSRRRSVHRHVERTPRINRRTRKATLLTLGISAVLALTLSLLTGGGTAEASRRRHQPKPFPTATSPSPTTTSPSPALVDSPSPTTTDASPTPTSASPTPASPSPSPASPSPTSPTLASASPTSANPSLTSASPLTDAGGPQPEGPTGTFVQVFGDEFDGTSLDASKWTAEDGHRNNNVISEASLVTVSGGAAHLQIAQDASGQWRGGLAYTGYGSGRYQFKVGDVVEARIYLPGTCAAGVTSCDEDVWDWPGSVWTSGQNWPANGELDLAEGLSGHLTINYHSSSGASNGSPLSRCCYGNAWHVVTAERTATQYTVWWDGVLQRIIPSTDGGGPQAVIMNIGISGSRTIHAGPEGQTDVDYVRAWTRTH